MEYRTAAELAAALQARQVSAVELADQAIAAIEAGDGEINAVVVRDFDRARAAARAADQALARGETRPLLGVPITVKEAFNVAGLPTTWGLPGTSGIPVAEDAVVVQRLKAAGAVVLGKTNVSTMLADWQSANPVYGVTRNPWDLTRTAGGSSGGGAAALAAGFVSLEYGSDLASSLRAPAAFCGVYAHKPSFGIVPQRGFAPPGVPIAAAMPAIDLSVLGPMARGPGDLLLALEVTAGPDAREGAAWRLDLPPTRHEALNAFRVLVADEHPLLPTCGEIRTALAALATRLEAEGCRVGRGAGALPDLEATAALQVELMMAQFSADTPDEAYAGARTAAAVAGPTDIATASLRGMALSHRDWIRADRRRFDLINAWRRLFEDWDAVICPAMPTLAFAHDARPMDQRTLSVDGADMPYLSQPLWGTLANLTGNPATAFPLGLSAEGLPMGAQIVGPYLEDRTTLAFAAHLETAFGGFTRPTSR
ncbi:MAG TPA: amidase [Caulobacteraceae bacterium]